MLRGIQDDVLMQHMVRNLSFVFQAVYLGKAELIQDKQSFSCTGSIWPDAC